MKFLLLTAAILLSCSAAPQYGPSQSHRPATASPSQPHRPTTAGPHREPGRSPSNQESSSITPVLFPADTDQESSPVFSRPENLPVREVSSSSVVCHTEVATIWNTEYTETEEKVCNTVVVEECSTAYTRECEATTRQECSTVQDRQCSTITRQECQDIDRTVVDYYTETECIVVYQEDCQYHWEGEGNEKVWVVDPNTCTNNPVDNCEDVEKQNERVVTDRVCEDVPEEKCIDVPREVCVEVPGEPVCVNQPYTECEDVPREKCEVVHKRIPKRVSRNINKKVCDVAGEVVTKNDKLRSGDDEEEDDVVNLRTSAVVFDKN